MVSTERKTIVTKRSLTYSYLFAAPRDAKPTLFFAHGFPSTGQLWRRQVEFFGSRGYGLIVPDMLGYGGTSKPTDPAVYIGSGLAADVVDILDKEGVSTVITVAHDWGTHVVSRLINYHPERVSASIFLAVGYIPPIPKGRDIITNSKKVAELVGYDIFAYMRWFVTEEAARLIDGVEDGQDRIDSFINLLYPEKPELWRDTNMCVDGGAREWIVKNRRTALPAWMTPEDFEYHRKQLKEGGLSAPLCWYKMLQTKETAEDDAKVLDTKLTNPMLYIPFLCDCICRRESAAATYNDPSKVTGKVTVKELPEADHWGVESHGEEINGWILEWLGEL
ncbi:alpha/beta-hydrolase [Roridomyces roridus]|uniref:Alpha/beta-hydrolase n=1 Tax=Roridomyces roridus TaxID=1738132 RepID=A0AAD7FNP0_9AGAR|nr:alpha/beta-hydrolase [Roridomyces roridus]